MNLNLIISLVLVLIKSGHGERSKDTMYEHFDGKASCFRRLNATHQTGCSSKRDGSTGIIHYVEQAADLDFILKSGNAGDYMPIIPTFLLTQATISALKRSKKVSGLLLYNDTEAATPNHYSHDLTCPNANSNDKSTCETKWNEPGTGILHQDLPFPVYYIDNDEDLKKLKDCFHKFNNFSYDTQYTRSLCFVELDSFMYAAKDTPTCIRRSNMVTNLNPVKVCDPLGGENIWSSLYPIENDTKPDGYIVVAARLDTTSMFNALYTGAVNPITSLVTLLSTADLLKKLIPDRKTFSKNILFVLFNGETYDYIGSQRMVYDMENDAFPMKLNNEVKQPMPLIRLSDISLFIELSQLTKSSGVYVHKTKVNPNEADLFAKKLLNYAGNLNVIPDIIPDLPLPPGSIQSFARSNSNLSGLVVADYKEKYTNKYYNSLYDDATNLNYKYYNTTNDSSSEIPSDSIQSYTQSVSSMLAKALYEEITGLLYTGNETAKLELIDELYNCYLLDPDCRVHQAVQRKKLKETPHNSYSLYVGVTVVPNLLTYVIGLTLGWLTGDIVESNKSCNNDLQTPALQYFNMSKSLDDLNTTVCYRTTMNFSEAISPAFIIKDYDWKSGKYSSWAESTWKDLTVRMFLKPSAAHERFTLAIGSITLIMSLILVYFVKSRSHILFVTPEACSPTSC